MNKLRLHGKEIVTGPGSLNYLQNLNFKKYIIVTGQSSMFKNKTIDRIVDILKNKDASYTIFSGIGANPDTDTVLTGVEEFKKFEPECVICVGGGSAIDAAKVMTLMYEYPQLDFINIKSDILDMERKKTTLIAIPSTAGTGTEVTKTAVITFNDINLKIGLKSYAFIPDVAILDGEITLSMPKSVVAHSGMDALTHAVECYINHNLEEFSEALCAGAIQGLFKYLPKSYSKGDITSRQKVLTYQSMAGSAFHNIGLGMDHGISHAFGGKYGYGHGLLNAVGLPYVLKYNSRDNKVKEKLDRLAKLINVDDFIEAIKQLNSTLNIPSSFKEMGITEEDYLHDFEELLNNSLLGSTKSNPVPMTKVEMRKVLDSIFYGEIRF
ncbi:iron-containing alcohol dehydrogenase [Alkalibacter mobilis]|uniref:iron-containing alcohol dehydrogenase n=1 Tax=Alkalibacter mobilis TaxID=2787712 RepID=UPI00189E21BE|nr:iron-containing alcohol dehydrogenase [Alkalibacter mobilis]MBF7095692.1 iron-containing alcohol dehydrogenase [Alkalibacter mobilis]